MQDDFLKLELAGPGLEPETVDTRRALALADAYFDLLARIADYEELDLQFEGLQVENKCVAITAKASDTRAAQAVVALAGDYVRLGKGPPGFGASVDRVRTTILQLPTHYETKVFVGAWSTPLTFDRVKAPPRPWTQVTLRAEVLRLGGKSPRVLLDSPSEDAPFTLKTSRDLILHLAAYVYREVDIEAEITRGRDGRISEGVLNAFHPLEDDDATKAWRDWFASHSSHWTGVDIDSELGRTDD